MQHEPENSTRIYLLPNLMTAGNLLCGFLAVLRIFEGSLQRTTTNGEGNDWIMTYESSLYFILGAFIFDILDGRLARLGGHESPFGREFDSLADVISFGVAPALLVFHIVLYQLQDKIGWAVASIYLVCGALRLARFNVYSMVVPHQRPSEEFTGFPIPAAAGLVSSITLLMLHFYEKDRDLEQGWGKFLLAGLLLFLSFMMFSKFKYPSFKAFSLRTEHSLPKFILVVVLLILVLVFYWWMLAVVFITYLFYGFLRPFLSRAMRREIEEDEADELDRSGHGPPPHS